MRFTALLLTLLSAAAPAFAQDWLESDKHYPLERAIENYYHGPNMPVSPFLGRIKVEKRRELGERKVEIQMYFDFLLYNVDDDTLHIYGEATAYLGCHATVVFTPYPSLKNSVSWGAEFRDGIKCAKETGP